MFRLLQGDVGSGKTIVSLIAAHSIISNKYQVAYMAPTEILAKQHYKLFSKVFGNSFYSEILTGKTEYKNKKNILLNLKNKKIDIIFGTHALFQKTIEFKKLGLIIIDEQHKFGVNQRKKLSEKGGSNCDVLIMSATPIPRTMMMTLYGDMDITLIKSKPKNRKEIKTYTKDINKIDDVINFLEKEVNNNNQIFWVCPLIEESKKLDHQSCIVRYEYLKKIFKNKIGLLHGSIDNDKKEEILNNFLNNKIKILVSTTIIEVGIDFPNATCIVIEDSNKFGLSQLHQLRGRVGRGEKQSSCILLYKSSLSENAKKRLKILKSSNNGFFIAEEDLKLRSYGDLLGFQQSGQKTFKLADPILNEDLFLLAEKEIKIIENEDKDLSKYNSLIKLYDRADIVNELI
jgi:ATP-dependent DNA helicase RecG